ncbi:MAG: hypothetical protein HYV63_14700 [Candidatus Schekmanbacteria bacterium]|nr:hypothetical protein [Candidatus Schekmanbacteria bacterium]
MRQPRFVVSMLLILSSALGITPSFADPGDQDAPFIAGKMLGAFKEADQGNFNPFRRYHVVGKITGRAKEAWLDIVYLNSAVACKLSDGGMLNDAKLADGKTVLVSGIVMATDETHTEKISLSRCEVVCFERCRTARYETADYEITLRDFFDEHRKNEFVAEKKYEGAVLQFSGALQEVHEKALVLADSRVGGQQSQQVLRCSLSPDQDEDLYQLENGQPLTVRGVYGEVLGSQLGVNECVLVK